MYDDYDEQRRRDDDNRRRDEDRRRDEENRRREEERQKEYNRQQDRNNEQIRDYNKKQEINEDWRRESNYQQDLYNEQIHDDQLKRDLEQRNAELLQRGDLLSYAALNGLPLEPFVKKADDNNSFDQKERYRIACERVEVWKKLLLDEIEKNKNFLVTDDIILRLKKRQLESLYAFIETLNPTSEQEVMSLNFFLWGIEISKILELVSGFIDSCQRLQVIKELKP